MKKLFTAILFVSAFLVQAQDVVDNSAFAKANKAYTAGNYDLAIAAYKQILKGGQHSAAVYFNLGNAYYKQNVVGESIYYYEKALQLEPKDEDVLNNLRFASQMKIDAIEPLPENAIGSTIDEIAGGLSVDEWAYLSIVFVLVTILLAVFYTYAATPGKKRLFFILTILGVIISVTLIATAFYARNEVDSQRFAIIMIDEIAGREAPKQNSEKVFTIHEGTKIQLLEDFEEWSQVMLENGSKAWLPADVFREL